MAKRVGKLWCLVYLIEAWCKGFVDAQISGAMTLMLMLMLWLRVLMCVWGLACFFFVLLLVVWVRYVHTLTRRSRRRCES